MKLSVFRKTHFNAAHRLHNPNWDAQKNRDFFGLCNNPHYHGHNYNLIVKITGEVDPETGYLIDMKRLKDMITTHVLDKFDHKNLNLEVAAFKKLNPTMENISIVIWNILREQLNSKYQLNIRLYETERNFVEYPAG